MTKTQNRTRRLARSSEENLLRELLLTRTRKNPAYSLRALGRDLGVSAAYVSLVLSGKKRLSLKRAIQVNQLLGRGVLPEAVKSKYLLLEMDRFHVLGQWFHLAILDLTTCSNFQPRVQWVARRLRISTSEVRDAVERLQRVGLLKVDGSRWVKTERLLFVPTKKSEPSVREFHTAMLERARQALSRTEPEEYRRRTISGFTIAANSARIAEAKERVRRFQSELVDFLTEGECDEVYQLGTQLFPLTEKFKGDSHENA